MGFVYEDGGEYPRPGVYRRYSNETSESTSVASAVDGIGKLTIQADWGPLNTVTTHYRATAKKTIKNTYGTGGTTSVATAYFDGGLTTLYLVRVGSGGTQGSLVLTAGDEATDAVTLTLLYPGAHEFTATVRDSLTTDGERDLVIYDGATVLETISFEAGDAEPEALAEAVTSYGSSYITAAAAEGVTGSMTAVANAEFTGGTDPTVTADDYTTAFEALEPYFANTIALDTIDEDVQTLLQEYENEAAEDGVLDIFVIGTSGSTDLQTRMSNASSYNDPTAVYFGSDYEDADGNVVSGAEAIATTAGVIAATPSNKSIVHSEMPNAANVTERLKNSEYTSAISKGLLLLSLSANGDVVFDSGVTTLVDPSEEQDDGWKKIKRVKVRHEMFYRLDKQMDNLIGKVNVDTDGIANVIQQGQAVLDEMEKEKKLISPTFTLDEDSGYGADYAYFIVSAVDIDTLERIFLHYQFKYSENS